MCRSSPRWRLSTSRSGDSADVPAFGVLSPSHPGRHPEEPESGSSWGGASRCTTPSVSSRTRCASSSAVAGWTRRRPCSRTPPGRRGPHRLRRARPVRRSAVPGDPTSLLGRVFDAVAGSGRCSATSTTRRSRRSGSTSRAACSSPGDGRSELTTTILTADAGPRPRRADAEDQPAAASTCSQPFVDATLPDGSRCTSSSPTSPASTGRSTSASSSSRADASRRPGRARHADARRPRDFLEAAVVAGLNILVSGGTQAGKTTLLNCLAAAVPPRERVITCEEVFELKVAAARLGRDADPAAEPRGHGRDPAAPAGQGGAADAAEPDRRRRGAPGGVPRPAHRAQQRTARACARSTPTPRARR